MFLLRATTAPPSSCMLWRSPCMVTLRCKAARWGYIIGMPTIIMAWSFWKLLRVLLSLQLHGHQSFHQRNLLYLCVWYVTLMRAGHGMTNNLYFLSWKKPVSSCMNMLQVHIPVMVRFKYLNTSRLKKATFQLQVNSMKCFTSIQRLIILIFPL